jgi:hypothetical protein
MYRFPLLLRRTLMFDAATCAAAGFLLLIGAGVLDAVLGLPAALLRWSGGVLLAFAAVLAYVGTRSIVPREWVGAIIVSNLAWAAASLLLLVSGWVAPTTLGYAFVIAQALAVIVLAELEYLGLWNAAEAPA